MSSLSEILKKTGDGALDLIKDEFLSLFNEAKADSEEMVKENAAKLEKWLVMLAEGEIDKMEFDALVDSRKRVMEQFLNTMEIIAKARLEKITMGLIDLALDKIAPALII